MQAGGDAEVEGDRLGLARGDGDLLGIEVLDLLGFWTGLAGIAEERGLRRQGEGDQGESGVRDWEIWASLVDRDSWLATGTRGTATLLA